MLCNWSTMTMFF